MTSYLSRKRRRQKVTAFEIIVIVLLALTNFYIFLILGIVNTICTHIRKGKAE